MDAAIKPTALLRFLVFALVLSVACKNKSIQETDSLAHYPEETSYQSQYYYNKVADFESLPVQQDEVIWIGDSITDGADWEQLFPSYQTVNFGINADNTFGVLRRLNLLTRRQPLKAFILVGINDVAMNTPVDVILYNHRKIVQQIKRESVGTQIYLQSLLPTNHNFTNFPRHQNKGATIQSINLGLAEIAAQEAITFVNLYSELLDGVGRLDTQYTNDGLHLNSNGYQKWKDILILNSCL